VGVSRNERLQVGLEGLESEALAPERRWYTWPVVARFRKYVGDVGPFAVAAVAESRAVGDTALAAVAAQRPAGAVVAESLVAVAGAPARGFADADFRAAAPDVAFFPIPASRTPIAPPPFALPSLSRFLAFQSPVARAALAHAWLAGTTLAGVVATAVAAEPAVVPPVVVVAVDDAVAAAVSIPSDALAPSELDPQAWVQPQTPLLQSDTHFESEP